MTKKSMDEEYGNNKPVDFRTKLALKILMLMIRIIMPYRYEHQFDKQMNEIAGLIDKIEKEQE